MDRMKTFFIYFLILVIFFIVSNLLENGLIYNMYSKIYGTINNTAYIKGIFTELEIIDKDSRATNVNGYINLNIKNNMNSNLKSCFLKLDLYNERNLLAETEYIQIDDLNSGDAKNYNLKFKANNIDRYEISLVDEKPDESSIIRIFGWEIDLSKYGIDPKNVFGIDLTALSLETIKKGGISVWNFCLNFVKSIPLWAYVVAGGIVLWYLPSGYLFFL
ncbi:MAG: hypothetical protein ACI4UE_03400 [Candidatus Scatovivens sp.]